MKRIVVLAVISILSLVLGAFAPGVQPVRAGVTRLPIVLLVQRTFYVLESGGCRIDVEGQQQVLLKVNTPDGHRRGGAWFAKGEQMMTLGPSGSNQGYCAFVKRAEVKTTGEVDLVLHNTFLTTMNLDQYVSDTHVVLEVNERGLVAESVATPDDVLAMGLEPQESVESDTGVSPVTGTAEVKQPKGISTDTTLQSDVVPGVWLLVESDTSRTMVVYIYEDAEGTEPEAIRNQNPEELRSSLGSVFVSEDPAPEGCRAFTLKEADGSILHMGLCADGTFGLVVEGFDPDVVQAIMRDFVDGKPFTIPPGYNEL